MGIGGYYKASIVGHVYDLDGVLLDYDWRIDGGIWVYVRPWKRDGIAHFVVDKIAENMYPDGTEHLRMTVRNMSERLGPSYFHLE